MGSGKGARAPSPVTRSSKGGSITENPVIAILSYCGSSILMTVTNKYVLSGRDFNLNFFLLCVQSVVCIVAISFCKASGIITYRDFNSEEARKCKWSSKSETTTLANLSRVPHCPSPHWHDLHEHLGAQVPLDSRLHHLQEPDYHSHRIRRGAVVRWLRHPHGPFLIRSDDSQLRHRSLGRYSACSQQYHGTRYRGDDRCRLDLARWILVDAV
jgi:hypothetical protein